MTKKKNKKSTIKSEQDEVKPVETNAPEPESISDEIEENTSGIQPPADEVMQPEQTDAPEEEVPSDDDEISSDILLDDVRRSLIEENAKIEEEKKPSFWQRIGVGPWKRKKPDEPDTTVEVPEYSDAAFDESAIEQSEDAGEPIDELIEMLETDEEKTSSELVPVGAHVEQEEPEVEVEKVDVKELKKRAFQSKPEDKDESFSDVRAVALEDGEEVFVEVEVKTEDTVEDRLKSFENALRPYRRYINFGIAFIGIVVIIITSALLYDTYRRSLPPEPIQEAEALPYPVVLNLPGGLSFNLGRGILDNGRWDPRRPEWLEGTEICRWVAVPYSRQLEAVVRTLTRDDKLELVMSNSDEWTYDVFSITQMSIEDMQKASENSSCLLLVLADVNTDTRWVVTAYP